MLIHVHGVVLQRRDIIGEAYNISWSSNICPTDCLDKKENPYHKPSITDILSGRASLTKKATENMGNRLG